MPVDALLGIQICPNYLMKQVQVNFKESPFYKPGIIIGKNLQIYYLLPQQR
jgi:hypothetical protein